MSVQSTIQFAIDLIKDHGHATNEDCHAYHGAEGYCVGMAVILGSEAGGKSYEQAKRDSGCRQGRIWHDQGVGSIMDGMQDWTEARRYVAWSWGVPWWQNPSDLGEDAAVTPNQYAKRNGIDPIPYLENALAMSKGEALPHPDLKPLDAWWRCEDGCGTIISDPFGPCEKCDEAFMALVRSQVEAMRQEPKKR